MTSKPSFIIISYLPVRVDGKKGMYLQVIEDGEFLGYLDVLEANLLLGKIKKSLIVVN